MLRRKQILLSDWLDDYIQELRRTHNWSYSEIVRMVLGYGFGEILKAKNPNVKFNIDAKLVAQAKLFSKNTESKNELDKKLLADIDYEIRKVLEQEMSELKELK